MSPLSRWSFSSDARGDVQGVARNVRAQHAAARPCKRQAARPLLQMTLYDSSNVPLRKCKSLIALLYSQPV